MSFTPCLLCGACCAFYRASFYWREADDITPGGVPVSLTDDLTQTYRVMKGTDSAPPRCVALQGDIGHSVFCSIYQRRSTPCREFTPSYADGQHNPRCDKARAAHGLPPLRPEEWQRPPDDLRPAA
jgi:hypothetical protein